MVTDLLTQTLTLRPNPLPRLPTEIQSHLNLTEINPGLLGLELRPAWQGPEEIQVYCFILDEPWATTAEIEEKIRELGGTPLSAYWLLRLAYANRAQLVATPLMVALGSIHLEADSTQCLANLWRDAESERAGFGLLPKTQEWRRGDYFPCWIAG